MLQNINNPMLKHLGGLKYMGSPGIPIQEAAFEFCGYSGDIENDEEEGSKDYVSFTINVCPDENADYSKIRNIKAEIKVWEDLSKFVRTFGKKIDIETDFYYSEGDFLIRLDIPLSHPLLQMAITHKLGKSKR